MFSDRLPPHTDTNRLTRALEALRARGESIIDLTESNPTRVDLPYPSDLLSPLADPRALRYEPHPLGLAAARAAVAADHARRGVAVDPAHVVLAASTSEVYTWLFKLLCNPGAAVLVPRPSYPLFEHLTRLEGVRAEPYDLEYHGRWQIDFASLSDAPADARAVLVVSPNNPTGSYVTAREVERLEAFCRERGMRAHRRRSVRRLSARGGEPGHRHRRARPCALVHPWRAVEVGRVAAAQARVDDRRRPCRRPR